MAIYSTEYWVLEIYKADGNPGATSLPATLQAACDEHQMYRNMIANVQDECDTFCTPAWIYRQWKESLL